jgi:hypothetical protein
MQAEYRTGLSSDAGEEGSHDGGEALGLLHDG